VQQDVSATHANRLPLEHG